MDPSSITRWCSTGAAWPTPTCTPPIRCRSSPSAAASAGNRHIVLPQKTENGNLWLSVANQFGSSLDSFGQSTGTVELFG